MHQSSYNHQLTTHENLQPDKNTADSTYQQKESGILNANKSISIQDGSIELKNETKQSELMGKHSQQSLNQEAGCKTDDKNELMIQLPDNVANSTKIFFKPQQIKLSAYSKVKEKPLQDQKIDHKKFQDLNWMRKLRYFYEYFCKSSYIAGKYSTFERIKNSVHVMTISKFVNFCRNFQINETLNDLKNIFKQSTNYKPQMNFDQFLHALCTIANNCLTENNDNDSCNQFLSSKDNKQLHYPATSLKTKNLNQQNVQLDQKARQNLIKYLMMKIGTGLDQKKQQISKNSRKHGINAHENLIKLKTLSRYKFEVKALNGKNSEQMNEQVSLRKKIKQKEKQKMRENKLEKAIKQQQKFRQLNKIAISEKKIAKGGFISPPIQTNKTNKATILLDTKKMVFENSKSNLSSIYMKPVTNGYKKIINSKDNHDLNIRHQTQMNTYNNNSFDDSNPETSLFKEHSRQQTQSKMTAFKSNPSEKSSTYLKTYMNKEMMSREQSMKYRDRLKMNRVITQAKFEVDPKKKGQLTNAEKMMIKYKQEQKKINSIREQVMRKNLEVEIAGSMIRENETAEDIKVWLQELNEEDDYLNAIFKQKSNPLNDKGKSWIEMNKIDNINY